MMNFAASDEYRGEGRIVQHLVVTQHLGKLEFRPEDVVLDVGFATGEETKVIAEKVRSVVGIDVSEEMLASAVKYNSAPNVTYVKGDAETCGDNPEWRGRFDKVVSFFVLNFVPDKGKAFRSILACLKPDGEGLFIASRDNVLIDEAVLHLAGHTKWGKYVKGFKYVYSEYPWSHSTSETEDLLKQAGWTNTQCEIHSEAGMCMSEKQTKLALNTLLPHSARIPPAEQGEYLDDLWRWALSRFQDESQDGFISVPMNFMIMHAYK